MRIAKAIKVLSVTIICVVVLAGCGKNVSACNDGGWGRYAIGSWNGVYDPYCCEVPYFVGPLRRIADRIQTRWATRPYLRGYFGSCCCCDPCCYPSCCFGFCCNRSIASLSPLVDYCPPVLPTEMQLQPAPTVPAEVAPATQSVMELSNAWLQLLVPADARVFLNDSPTTTKGKRRTYVSRGLQPGRNVSCNLRVEYQVAGQPVVQRRVVDLMLGETVAVRFDPDTLAQDGGPQDGGKDAKLATTTNLTVRVPQDAKVILAGLPTKARGTLRRFQTTALAAGKAWEDYTVRVELVREGKTLTKECTLQVEGGKRHELQFDFSNSGFRVAQLSN